MLITPAPISLLNIDIFLTFKQNLIKLNFDQRQPIKPLIMDTFPIIQALLLLDKSFRYFFVWKLVAYNG